MIKIVNKSNIDLLNNSFLNKEEILNELNNNPFAKVLIYIENNNIIGYLYYSDIYDRIEINQIETLINYRNKGIASKLLEELLKLKKDITLEVNENNISAIKLYEKYNFKKVAIRKNYYKNKDGILMERKYVIKWKIFIS